MCLQDGYKLIRANQLVTALTALNEGQISFRAFRVYLACHELVAIREAAERSSDTPKGRRRFLHSEVSRFVNGEQETPVCRELASLRRVGLLFFAGHDLAFGNDESSLTELRPLVAERGANRLVPVPRKMLAFLASCSKPALAKTIVAYLLRGLALDKSGKLRNAGTVKISWICKLCGISERAARSARAELIRLGWISKDTGSFQRKLNRDGAYFLINTAWMRVVSEFAPPRRKECREFAPLPKRPETPTELKNQKPAGRGLSGVFEKQERKPEKPILTNIVPRDLESTPRLLELFRQAVTKKLIIAGEGARTQFLAAAEHARVHGRRNACGLFATILRRSLWHVISHEDEDAALRKLKAFQSRMALGRGGENVAAKMEMPCSNLASTLAELVARLSMEPGKKLLTN